MSRTKDSGEEMRLLETMDNMLMAHLCFLMMCLSLVIPFQKRLKDDYMIIVKIIILITLASSVANHLRSLPTIACPDNRLHG